MLSFLKSLFGSGSGDVQRDSAAMAEILREDPRRYKRALLQVKHGLAGARGSGRVQEEIASASAEFRGGTYSVVDLSHTGIAIERGTIDDSSLPNPQQAEDMKVTLGLNHSFSLKVSLARHSDTVIAFEFADISTEARLTIDRFLDPKMIGLNMRAVDRRFFASGETFSLWFCGPRDTNFFLWMAGDRLERAIIQLNEVLITLSPDSDGSVRAEFSDEKKDKKREIRPFILFALDVALQLSGEGSSQDRAALNGFVKLLTKAAS